jgi:hypothetical protein
MFSGLCEARPGSQDIPTFHLPKKQHKNGAKRYACPACTFAAEKNGGAIDIAQR